MISIKVKPRLLFFIRLKAIVRYRWRLVKKKIKRGENFRLHPVSKKNYDDFGLSASCNTGCIGRKNTTGGHRKTLGS
jgi:hypothetical protein